MKSSNKVSFSETKPYFLIPQPFGFRKTEERLLKTTGAGLSPSPSESKSLRVRNVGSGAIRFLKMVVESLSFEL